MPNEETNQATGEQKAAPPPDKIGQRKTPEVDALQPTPERKAKTGEK